MKFIILYLVVFDLVFAGNKEIIFRSVPDDKDVYPNQVLLQPDGKILTFSNQFSPGVSYSISRFSPQFELDKSFGQNGHVIVPHNGEESYKIIRSKFSEDGIVILYLVSRRWNETSEQSRPIECRLMKLNMDGSQDSKFEIVTLPNRGYENSQPHCDFEYKGNYIYTLLSTKVHGDFDRPTENSYVNVIGVFDSSGRAQYNFINLYFEYEGVKVGKKIRVDSKGRILLFGFNSYNLMSVQRYLKKDTLDLNFANFGNFSMGHNAGAGSDMVSSVEVLSDDSVLIADFFRSPAYELGMSYDKYNYVTKITPDGDLDTDFGNSGVLEFKTKHIENMFASKSFFVAKDNSFILKSREYVQIDGSDKRLRYIFTKFRPNGKLDKNFGNAGSLQPEAYSESDSIVEDIAFKDDGSFLGLGAIGRYYFLEFHIPFKDFFLKLTSYSASGQITFFD